MTLLKFYHNEIQKPGWPTTFNVKERDAPSKKQKRKKKRKEKKRGGRKRQNKGPESNGGIKESNENCKSKTKSYLSLASPVAASERLLH